MPSVKHYAMIHPMNAQNLTITLAQINPLVGDIEGNTDLIINEIQTITASQPMDLIAFPELCITGYPPEDLLLRPHLYHRCVQSVERILAATQDLDTTIIIGYPEKTDDACYNKAACIRRGKIIATYTKMHLPNYSVFDEKRYFTAGKKNHCIFTIKDITFGLFICEDTWFKEPAQHAVDAGAQVLISINASPYDHCKHQKRLTMLKQRVTETNCPLLYVNCIGGQDELVFDGGSIVMNPDANIAAQANFYDTQHLTVALQTKPNILVAEQALPETLSKEASIYQALVLGVRDYIEKNNFSGAIIGLSGGADSALMLAIAVDAIGAERVQGILMPSRFTADMSIDDAIEEANRLGVHHETISIEPMFEAFLTGLSPIFKDIPRDSTEENIQARIRGILLMALSNKFGSIVLTTGNKSEMSVGYATLYGDMAGGFAALKDIPKTLVYKLIEYRNTVNEVIPERVITRPPSAELSEDQKDQDTLPAYDILDAIIDLYVDQDQDPEYIIEQGFDRETVIRIAKMIQRNEYKRRQAPPGIRISERAYGKDRRYPITSKYFKLS